VVTKSAQCRTAPRWASAPSPARWWSSWDCHHVAAGQLPRRLLLDQVQVVGIDLRNHQRNVGRHAEGAGIGKHGAARIGKPRLQLPRIGRIHRGEDDLGASTGSAGCTVMAAMRLGMGVSRRQLRLRRTACRSTGRWPPARPPRTTDGSQEAECTAARPCRSRQNADGYCFSWP